VFGKGYRIAPQFDQMHQEPKRALQAEKRLEKGIRETQCMRIDMLTPAEKSARVKSLGHGRDSLDFIRTGTVQGLTSPTVASIQQDVEAALKNVLSKLKGTWQI